MPNAYLAFDLGASSCRAMLGILNGSPTRLDLVEIHRFEHNGLPTPSGPVWNLTGIWNAILEGLAKAQKFCCQENLELKSVGVDAWGVDWTLIGKSGELLSLPHCYRDPQNQSACQNALEILGGEKVVYDRTGIRVMEINTVFQLFSRFQNEPDLFAAADRLAFIPDLFHYWLSGKLRVERTIASTSSLINLETQDWDWEILRQLGLPAGLFGPISEPGTALGTILPTIAKATGVPDNIQVVLPASHDTGSAVAAMPASGDSWLYLSSGTWSLLGAELTRPNNSTRSFESKFTNEAGINRTTRYLKNINGLWLVQELRRDHAIETGDMFSFDSLTQLAREATPNGTFIDPNQAAFGQTGNMKQKIQNYLQQTGQEIPTSIGGYVRCCLNGLALCYRETITQLEQNLSRSFDDLIVVGGGTNNQLLNQLISDTVDKNIMFGSTETSAMGNVLVQAWGLDRSTDIRTIARASAGG